jgi:(heptosyl)LPS beta-1,4-glucosyltransferase
MIVPGRQTLGVVTISFNEERDMPGFLATLIDWVDELVIIDDGSEDRTEEIVRAAGAKVTFLRSPRQRGEYFAHQRNKGIDLAKSDWLLHMDVDERVTPELAREITLAIADPRMDGYRLRRLNFFLHRPMRGGGWADWNLVHLARRDKLRFRGMFHEECILAASEIRIGQLSEPMHHLNEDGFRKRLGKSAVYLEELVSRAKGRDRAVGVLDLAGRPLADFLQRYVLKLGFLDGIPGLIAAIHSATAVFRAHAVVWDEQNVIDRDKLEAAIRRRWQDKQEVR